MSTVPEVKGEMEGGEIDPSKFTEEDIKELARQYQEAVGILDQQRRLLDEANRVIMKLQEALRDVHKSEGNRDNHRAHEGVEGVPSQSNKR